MIFSILAIPQVYSVTLSFFRFFRVSRHISHPTVCVSHFSMIFSFFAILLVLQCPFLIFHVFKCFSPYSRSYHVYVPFPRFFSFFFCHNPGPRVCFSPFPTFSVFHTIFHILQCVFLIFQNCQFLAIIQVLQCAFLIFHLFQCFSP